MHSLFHSLVHMPHLGSNIPSNIYYASIGSEVSKFARTTSNINNFVTLSNRLLKKMQKEGSKHRSTISMLHKIFGKRFTVFNIFEYTAVNFIKTSLKLELYIYTFAYWLVRFCLVFPASFSVVSCDNCFHVIYLCFFIFALVYIPLVWHFAL